MQSIEQIVQSQKAFFQENQTKQYVFRLQQLTKIEKMIQQFQAPLEAAFWQDLHKSRFEVYATETGFVLQELREIKKKLKKWMRPVRKKQPLYLFGSKSYILNEPFGVVGIIGPFNYPFQLVMAPLIGALAAGNTAVIKPSEQTPNVSAVMAQMIRETFDPRYVAVVEGDKEVTQTFLEQPFDHLFFTGSTTIGQVVMEAAAKQLIPVTLELGGKSPAIITKDADLSLAAEKIVWGKFLNAGQTCVAPDYVLIEKSKEQLFLREVEKTLRTFYGKDPLGSSDYGRLATHEKWERMNHLLKKTQGMIACGGKTKAEENYLAPTVLTAIDWQDPVMQEELFGPILPVLTYNETHFEQEVIDAIKRLGKPLALYLFTENKTQKEQVLNALSFGGGVVNDTILHLTNSNLPFGGVGASGIGAYHGNYSFTTFSNQKAIVEKSKWVPLNVLYPPYSEKKLKWIKRLLK